MSSFYTFKNSKIECFALNGQKYINRNSVVDLYAGTTIWKTIEADHHDYCPQLCEKVSIPSNSDTETYTTAIPLANLSIFLYSLTRRLELSNKKLLSDITEDLISFVYNEVYRSTGAVVISQAGATPDIEKEELRLYRQIECLRKERARILKRIFRWAKES